QIKPRLARYGAGLALNELDPRKTAPALSSGMCRWLAANHAGAVALRQRGQSGPYCRANLEDGSGSHLVELENAHGEVVRRIERFQRRSITSEPPTAFGSGEDFVLALLHRWLLPVTPMPSAGRLGQRGRRRQL